MREGAGKGKRRKPQRFPAFSTQKSSGSLTAPDKTVTGYDKFSDALKATSTSKNADSADDYVLNLWQSVDCKNEQGYTTTYYYTPANAIFTLNGNNKSSGNTKDSAPCCFLVNRGEVTLNNCTFNDNKVELKGGTTTIEGCTFNSSVTLSGGGGFNDTADVNSGTFKGEVTIQSGYVRIMGGTFEQAVTIKSGKGYTINAGLFQGVVTAARASVIWHPITTTACAAWPRSTPLPPLTATSSTGTAPAAASIIWMPPPRRRSPTRTPSCLPSVCVSWTM